MPPSEPVFARVNRFWDPKNSRWAAKISPGEYYTSTENELISTVLGSCIAACVRNRKTGVGGMNHFMLPSPAGNSLSLNPDDISSRYGTVAMERLINSILKYGGTRRDLEVKVFGGAKVLEIQSPIGERNIEFVMSYVRAEGLHLAALDLGGTIARKVQFLPGEGKARVRTVHLKNHTVSTRETNYAKVVDSLDHSGAITIFSDEVVDP